MRWWVKRGGLAGLVVGVVAAVVGFSQRSRVAVDMIIQAPSPAYTPMDSPADVDDAVEVERAGARVRAWVLDPEGEARGTLLLLHGIRDSKTSLLDTARARARDGLRTVVVDSRGHGESSGQFLTYGVEEARDLRALVDELDRRDLLVLPLGVQGTSYGAATAIQYAAIDERVTTTVAIAPFASLREVVPAYVEWMGGPLAILVSADWTRDVIDQAGDEASFDPDLACPRCVAPNIQGSLFLIHAKDDERIPWQHSVSIRDAADAQLMLVDEAGHLGIGSAAGVPEATARWFEQELR